MKELRQRHGIRLGALGAQVRRLRRATKPWRDRLRRRPDPLTIQRSVRLEPEDYSHRRRRWHVLVDLIHDHCPGDAVVVVDIGCYQGHSSAHIHKYCPQVQIFAVDLEKPDPARDRISGLPRVTFLQGYSDVCAKGFEDDSVDLIFVDADHTEAGVRKDLDAWVTKLKPGGVIAGHDYGSKRHPGVTLAVDAYFSDHAKPVRVESDMVWWTLK